MGSTAGKRPFDRAARAVITLLLAVLAYACNEVFDIYQGSLRPPCASEDLLLIDDMEDGVSDICPIAGRGGRWYSETDGSSGTLYASPELESSPTLLLDGARGLSRRAAHLSGDGFDDWGAILGVDLNVSDLARQPYDASSAGGIRFWMKSDVPVQVEVQLPETTSLERGGDCTDDENGQNCDNHFGFLITMPAEGWAQYEVPFAALAQAQSGLRPESGSAAWTPREILGIDFWAPDGGAFDLWIDDVSFYNCSASECLPTCSDPLAPLPSAAGYGFPAACRLMRSGANSVWGSRSSDVWAVGFDLQHWDGNEWSSPVFVAPREGDMQAIWGAAANDAWTVGFNGNVFHWDGSRWSRQFVSDRIYHYYDVWGSAADDVWAVTSAGLVIHWDGAVWTEHETGTTESLDSIWGSAANDVWAVGTGSAIVHFDGRAWSPVPVPAIESVYLNSVWGSGPADVWALGERGTALHWDGNVWSEAPGPGIAVYDLWGASANDVWAVGNPGRVQHWDGVAWSAEEASTTDGLLGIWGSGPGDVWVVGTDQTILHRADSGWSALSGGGRGPYEYPVVDIWGTGPDDVWLTGLWDGRFHWDGARWTRFEATGVGFVRGLWGSSSNDVWGVFFRAGAVTHWDGREWTEPISDPGLGLRNYGNQDITGSSPNDIWVVGDDGIHHWDGSTWSDVPGGEGILLRGVWASSAASAWAVGRDGTILRWDGVSWSPVASGTDRVLQQVAGSAADDVWAVGDGIVHWDGSAWSPVVSPTRQTLLDVWARAADDAWAVGSRGTILHWDGSAWLAMPSPVPSAIVAVWGSAANDVWAGGDYGVLLHWDGASWTQFELSW